MGSQLVGPQVEINPTRIGNPALEFMRNYWDERRAGRLMPTRADMRPADFKQYLGNVAIVDVLDGGGEFRYRVVGTLLTRYFLTNPTGKTFTEAWPDPPGPLAMRVRANLEDIVQNKMAIYAKGTLDWEAFPGETFDALFLPLSDDGEEVTMILTLFLFNRSKALLNREIAKRNGVMKL
jgi:hypothetical protein